MKNHLALIAAALVLGMSHPVAAQHSSAGHEHAPTSTAETQKMMGDMTPRPEDPASTKGYKEAHMKMMRDMNVPLTGKSDVDFVRGMIPHHQGAIDMAKVQLAHGKDPQILEMARKIIADQEREIAEMQAWLKKNGE